MASVRARTKPTVGQLLETVKQLPPAELREFEQQFAAWRAQNGKPNTGSLQGVDDESLLACIRENSELPAPEQRRFNRLRRKRQAGEITDTEEKELQVQWRRVEQMNVKRLSALSELARRRGTDVTARMRKLKLSDNRDIF